MTKTEIRVKYIAMMVIWDQRQVVVKELGQKLYLDTGTLTPLLKKLEKKGLVALQPLPEDRRSVVASITPAGMTLREKAARVPAKVGACIGLEGEDAKALYTLTHKLLTKLRS